MALLQLNKMSDFDFVAAYHKQLIALNAFEQAQKLVSIPSMPNMQIEVGFVSQWHIIAENISRFSKLKDLSLSAEYLKVLIKTKDSDYMLSYDFFRSLSNDEKYWIIRGVREQNFDENIPIWFMNQIDTLFTRIHSYQPNKSELWNELKAAFENGFYSGVIMLCYAQADGIWRDEVSSRKEGLFDMKPPKPDRPRRMRWEEDPKQLLEMKLLIKQISEQFIDKKNTSAFRYSGDQVKGIHYNENDNNRHLIFHGHVSKFGNKQNAIKAIMLLDSVVNFAALISP